MAVVAPIVSTFDPKGIRQAERAFESFRDGSARAFGAIGDAAKKAAIAVAGVSVAAVAGASKAISAASDLAEAQSKNSVVFGESAARVEEFARAAADSFGQSTRTALDAAATFGTFGKAAGLSGDNLAEFSTGFVALASDLASFNNTSPEEAIQALGAGLRGESEPLRRFGVLLDDATLKQEALALGIYDGNGSLTAQQKILAAQAAIYKQTGDAQGDFARTAGGLANQQRILRARFDNVVASIGTKLLPIALKLAGIISNTVLPAIESLSQTFSERGLGGVLDVVGDKLGQAIPPAIAKAKELLEKLGRWIVDTGLPWIRQKLGELGAAFVAWIGPRIGPAVAKIGELVARLGRWIVDSGLPLLGEKLRQLGDAFVAWIEPLLPKIIPGLLQVVLKVAEWLVTEAIPKITEVVLQLAQAFVGWIVELAPALIRGIGNALVDLAKALPGLAWQLLTAAAKLGTNIASSMTKALVDAVKGLGVVGLEFGKSFVNAVIDFVNSQLIDRINGLLEFKIPVPMAPDINIDAPDIPRIPRLAEGGIVSSPMLAMIGDRKLSQATNPEAVVPLKNVERSGVVINISGAIDPVSTARQIRLILQRDAARLGLASAV